MSAPQDRTPLDPAQWDDRAYPPRPILGVGALIFEGDQILLIQRGKEPLKGYWTIPGGAVETGEVLREAMKREVKEETGLDVEPREVVEVFERITPDAEGRTKYHYVLIDYRCDVVGGTLQAASDVADARWVTLGGLGQYQLTSGTLPIIERAYRGRPNA